MVLMILWNILQQTSLWDQGSTLTVVRLGIPSSFCCRTTWTSVYGCPLVKSRKSTKQMILEWSFISDWVNRELGSESVNTFDLQCTQSCKFYFFCFFHLCSKRIKSDWRATLDPSMVSLEGVLSVYHDVIPALIMWREGGQQHRMPHFV